MCIFTLQFHLLREEREISLFCFLNAAPRRLDVGPAYSVVSSAAIFCISEERKSTSMWNETERGSEIGGNSVLPTPPDLG